jgi:polysaccharide biosynthesis protein PslH
MPTHNAKILLLSWYSFESADSGERVRAYALRRELERQFRVTTLNLDSAREPAAPHTMHLSPTSTIPYAISRTAYLRSTVRGRAIEDYLLHRRRARDEVDLCIEMVRPDAILAVQPYVWPLVPARFQSMTIVDTHNINSARLSRLAASMPRHDPRKLLLHRQVRLSREFEKSYSRLAGQVWTVSKEDADCIDSDLRHRVKIVPNGADFPSVCPEQHATSSPLRMLFFGSLDYSANLDGLRMLRHWTDANAIAQKPTFRVTVAGSGDGKKAMTIVGQHPAFDFVGRVASPYALYRNHDCLIVPLRQGGGSRLKILEAVASGLPVISTEIGVEGTGLVAGQDYLRAESSEDLVKQIEVLMQNSSFAQTMTASAFSKVATADWTRVGSRAARFIRELVSEERPVILG